MKTLNLVNPEKSEIKHKISRFPDGQQNLMIENTPDEEGNKLPGYYYWAGKSRVYSLVSVTIKSRLNNWLDLELIVCAVASLRELGVEEIHLYTPYIVGGRSDRKFEDGGNNYLKDVICPVINSLNFKTVTCLDPHSDILEACIKGFRKESNLKLVAEAIGTWCKLDDEGFAKINDFILVSPDAGASKKIFKVAEQIGYKGDIITCSKERDTDGKLTKTKVPSLYEEQIPKPYDKDLIIIDDICDGGATFLDIAKKLKEDENSKFCKLYLVVTHGIFSKGFIELSKYFDGVYCTNSYSDLPKWQDANGKIITCNHEKLSNFINQLNVF